MAPRQAIRRRPRATIRAAGDTNPDLVSGPLKLSGPEVASLAIAAGFSTKPGSARRRDSAGFIGSMDFTQAAVAVAIAQAESGFDAHAINSSSGATGLWQIHPGGRRYLNPRRNAATAYRKYLTQGWRAWSVYTSGAFLQYMGAAERHVAAAGGPAPSLDPGEAVPHGVDFGLLGIGPAPGILPEIATGWVRDLLGVLVPVLKVGAGGLGLLVCAVAVVYVAGKNQAPTAAVAAAARSLPGVQGVAARRALERTELRKARAGEARKAASDLAGARLEVIQAGDEPGRLRGDRTRVVSRREGLERLVQERRARAEYEQSKAESKRDELAALRQRKGNPRRREYPGIIETY